LQESVPNEPDKRRVNCGGLVYRRRTNRGQFGA
jgi:hypothetical protein